MNLSFLRPLTRHRKRIDAYVDGSLTAATRAEFERHLEGCDTCARDVDTSSALRAELRRLPDPVAPRSFRLSPAMIAPPPVAPLLSQPRPHGRGVVGARFAAAAAAAVLAAAIVIDVIPRGGGDGSTTAASAERDVDLLSSTDKAAGGSAAASQATAAAAAPRAASAPSADTGAISGAGAELASSPTAAASQNRAGDTVAEPTPDTTDVVSSGGELQDSGNNRGWWTSLRIVQAALAATLGAAVGAMVVLSRRQRRATQ